MIYSYFLNLVSKILFPYKLYYAKKHNLIFIKPDYWIVNKLNKKSTIVDVGLGNDADFSQELINLFNVHSYGFDPTRKHHPNLNIVTQKLQPYFTYFPIALAHKSGKITFFETKDNISGSLSSNHTNVLHDRITSYQVDALTLPQIISLTRQKHIDLLKIDIEGEEYLLIKKLTAKNLKFIDQLIIEFHHQTIKDKTFSQTKELIKHLNKIGFIRNFTTDSVNFLFYR